MLSLDERLEILCQRKQEYTKEKQTEIGYIDADDSGMILPPKKFRKLVETISGSGMPVRDIIFNHYVPKPNHPNGNFYGARAAGENFRDLLLMHPPHIDPISALAGAYMTTFISYRTQNWNPDYPYDELKFLQEKYQLVHAVGAMHHFCQDMELGLKLGWDGIKKKIDKYAFINEKETDEKLRIEKSDFYKGLAAVVDGIQGFTRNNAEEAVRMAKKEKNPQLKENLLQLATMNRKLILFPPETTREACQWILNFQVCARMYNGSGSLGRLDVLLQPFYERDIRNGTVTEEEVVFYLCCYLLRDTAYLNLGGYDKDGHDVTNSMSYLILEAVHKTKIPSNIGVCVGNGVERNLLRRGVEHQFADKTGNPRFVGIDSLIEGYMKNGYSAELARLRTSAGCHWLSIPGREYCLQDCIKINLAVVFDVAFHEMMEEEHQSLEHLLERYEEHLKIAILEIAKSIDLQYKYMKYSLPELPLDLLCHGTIERGIDASGGGVDLYNFCLDASALAVVADSFASIRKNICEEKKYSFKQLLYFLDSNWAGEEGEKARLRFANCLKYGHGNTCADKFAVELSAMFTRLVKEKSTPDGHNMVPGLFSWANTVSMGKTLGATPNGRFAGQPISHGTNPCPGFREDGAVTAMSNAIACVQSGYGNTAPMQVEMEPALGAEQGGVEIVMALIEDHFHKGGTLINLNVMDAQQVIEAHKDPSKWPDLVVRVTGFSAYFASLSPDFRQLVVDRILDKSIC